jgi:hypothetical protein
MRIFYGIIKILTHQKTSMKTRLFVGTGSPFFSGDSGPPSAEGGRAPRIFSESDSNIAWQKGKQNISLPL